MKTANTHSLICQKRTHAVSVKALGYEDTEAQATVAQYDTTIVDIALTALPTYTISGEVKISPAMQ